MTKLSHLDNSGNATMIDVRNKETSHRVAIATGRILMKPETCRLIKDSAIKKGDVIASARIAGIMASKKTPELIPLCHPLNITKIEIDFENKNKEEGIKIIVKKSTGTKCPRCWKILEGKCVRCAQTTKDITV